MKKMRCSPEKIEKANHFLGIRNELNATQIGLSLILVFFGWFFILPTNVCSYAYVLAEAFHVTDSLFILLSNLAGLLGLLVGGALVIFISKTKKLLLYVIIGLNFFNILIFFAPPAIGLIFMLTQYLLLGVYVVISTFLFFVNTVQLKRYIFTGSILASIIFTTAFLSDSSSGVTAASVYGMNLILSAVVLVVSILLNIVKSNPPVFVRLRDSGRPILGAYLLLLVYTFIIAFSLGYLTNEHEFIIPKSDTLTSVLNIVPYVGTMILVFSLPLRKFHVGIITYIANAIMIIAIAFVDFFGSFTGLSAIINCLLYFAIAINQLFIFDTVLDLSEKAVNPSITISIGIFIFVLGSAIGDHVGEMILVDKINSIDRILITLIALASTILPMLRILLSKHSVSSVFRINPVALDPLALAGSSSPVPVVESPKEAEPSNIYPHIASYESLTNREKEVLDLLIKGYPSEVMCSTLFISTNTLKRHVQNIYNKLNVHNRAELFRLLHKS